MGLYRKENSFWSEQARPSLVKQGCRNRRGMTHQILTDQSILSQPEGQIMPTTLLLVPPAPPDFQTLLRPCRAPTNQAYHAIAVLTIFVPSKDGLLVPGDSWLLPFFKQWNQSFFRVVCIWIQYTSFFVSFQKHTCLLSNMSTIKDFDHKKCLVR